MGFIWFLVGVLFTAFVYFRLSKRLSSLNLELSEDLKSEIMSLIAEFNNSAERNISLIEDRTSLAKTISNEIAEQLSYMKKLKENLEKEIKETEAKLNTMIVNQKSIIPPESKKQKSVVAKNYDKIKNQIEEELKSKNEALKKEHNKLLQEVLAVKEQLLQKEKETSIVRKEKEELSSNRVEDVNEISNQDPQENQDVLPVKEEPKESFEKSDNEQDYKKQIELLAKKGYSIQEIATELSLTKGEVELVLKFLSF